MKPLRAFICWLLIATQAFAGITYSGTTGQTLYARVQTGQTTFVAAAIGEGSSGGLGIYNVTDAALVSAGLTTAGNSLQYTIRSGSPSTSANDPIKGYGSINWGGSTESLPLVQSSGSGKTYYVAPTAMGTMTLSSPSATFSIAARSTGTALSTEGNGTKTIVVVQGSSEGTAYNTGTDVLTVTVNISGGHNTVQHLINAINTGTHFTAFPSTSAASTISTSTTGSGTLSGGIDCSDSYTGLSKTTPFASAGAAHTASSAGDTIWLMSGNHADTGAATSVPFLTVTKDGIEVRGESQSLTIINDAGFDSGIWLNGKGDSCRFLKVVGTNPGDTAIFASGDWSTVEDVEVSTKEVGVVLNGAYNTGRRCKSTGGRYGLKVNGDQFILDQCTGTTDSSFTFEADSNFAGIYVGSAKTGVINNSSAAGVSITTASAGKLIGLSASQSGVICNNLFINVANFSASLTGGTYGIVNLNSAASIVCMNGGKITTTATSGSATDIDASVSGSYVRLSGTQSDSTKWTGTSNIHTQLEPATPGRTLLVDANGLADATAVKAGPSGSATALTANDLGATAASTNTRVLLGVPAVAPGAASGVLIAGPNAATTFASHTITGNQSINGTNNVAQTGDSFARIGANGSALSALAQSATALSNTQWTNTKAGFIDAAISTVSGGGAGGFTDTQRAQILAALSIGQDIGVPKGLTWVIARKDGDMKAAAVIPKDAGEGVDVAADFRNVLATGDAIAPSGGIVSITLVTTGSGLIASPAFTDVTQATLWMNSAVRFHITGGTAGTTYTVRVKVLTVGGNTLSALCQMKVTGS